jgi:hypothetical protein
MIKAVTYILENNATVASLIGNNAANDKTKVYPVVVPESEKAPYLVVRMTSKTLQGKGCNFLFGFEVICYAKSYDDLDEIEDAVTSALTGQVADNINGWAVSYIHFTNESDDFVKEHALYAKVINFEGSAIATNET